MSKKTRSARGDLVDFDLLAIKQQLSLKPVPVGVNERRRFIDEKDGIKQKATTSSIPDAFKVAIDAVHEAEIAANTNNEDKN